MISVMEQGRRLHVNVVTVVENIPMMVNAQRMVQLVEHVGSATTMSPSVDPLTRTSKITGKDPGIGTQHIQSHMYTV